MAAGLYSWKSLTEAINTIQTPQTMVLDKVFKNIEEKDTEYIDIDVIVGNKKLAPFVSPIEGGKVVEKLGQTQKTIKAPRIRIKKPLNPNDFMQKAAGASPYVQNGDIEKYKKQKIARELQDLKNRTVRRTEWMACQALMGSIVVEQDNVSFNIDFGLPNDHKPVLLNTDKWSDTTNSDPVADIRTWKTLIASKIGGSADLAFIGSTAAEDFLNHPKVQKLLDNRNIALGKLTIDGSNYIGNIAGVDIFQYDEKYVDDAGTVKSMIPTDAFILINTQAQFKRFYGAVLDLKAGANVAMAFFSKMYEEEDPPTLWLLSESRPIPVPCQPEAVVFATVR